MRLPNKPNKFLQSGISDITKGQFKEHCSNAHALKVEAARQDQCWNVFGGLKLLKFQLLNDLSSEKEPKLLRLPPRPRCASLEGGTQCVTSGSDPTLTVVAAQRCRVKILWVAR